MNQGARAPLRLCSADEAIAAAAGSGIAAILDASGTFTLAFSTPFGPCLRRHSAGQDLAFLVQVLRETVRGDYSVVAVCCARGDDAGRIRRLQDLQAGGTGSDPDRDPAAASAALEAFAARRPAVPVHSGRGGTARARSSTIAPCPGVSYETGAVLRPSAEDRDGGTLIRWRAAGGMDAGIHLVLGRGIGDRERALLGTTEAKVVSVTPGAMPTRDGTRRVQTLVLDVPHAFASAFADGTMPRHGSDPARASR